MNDSTTRFSNRVEDYVKYRPHYPAAIIELLKEKYAISTDKLVADIGAGTGISTAMFLEAGYTVVAVEPNKEMRDKAVELLGANPSFKAQGGTAEDTGIKAGSVDAVIAGQAFHWFDVVKTKAEFRRILTPGGIVVLIWNERKTSSDFEQAYDQLILKHARDYVKVDHRNIDTKHLEEFFSPQPVELTVFDNKQVFDMDGLTGRLLSSSYMPAREEEGYEEMIKDIQTLFDQYQQSGVITVNYDTKVYVGKLH